MMNMNFLDRSLGRCKSCKTPVRVDAWVGSAACPGCGTRVKLDRVIGVTTSKKCGARCLNAVGPSCDCSCGGFNHGGGH